MCMILTTGPAPKNNKKRFSVLLWNKIPPPNAGENDGYYFEARLTPRGGPAAAEAFLAWDRFKPFNLRGKPILINPPKLNISKIKRLSYLIRVDAGDRKVQEGEFWWVLEETWVVDGGKCTGYD